MSKRTAQIREVLERLYAKYNRREFIGSDPLEFVYRYSNPADMEIIAFLTAGLAYGRVEHIQKSLTDLFGRMGESPYAFVKGFGRTEARRLKGFKHRFTSGDDISALLELLRDVLAENGSLEKYFLLGYDEGDKNILSALSKFCDSLLDKYAKGHDGYFPRGLGYLLVRPAGGSACKRLNLFLRWMVREDDVDTGLWRSVAEAKLIVPVDVHMSRLCRILDFHNQRTVSLATAVKITECFTELAPLDPVRYDFALSRIGIVENCSGRRRSECSGCELLSFCSEGT